MVQSIGGIGWESKEFKLPRVRLVWVARPDEVAEGVEEAAHGRGFYSPSGAWASAVRAYWIAPASWMLSQ